MQWIAENQPVITALTGLGTLLVWIIYLEIFIRRYRRQLRANILITRGAGLGLDSHCFISNMSAGSLYVQSIIMTLEVAGDRWICPVTDLLDLEEEEAPPEPKLRTRQGPLASGDLKDLGTFGSLVRHVLRRRRGPAADLDAAVLDQLQSLEIEVLGVYGPEDLLVGARRKFLVTVRDAVFLRGETLMTEQIRKRSDRRKLIALLKNDP
jgi:hypothetical protein